MILDPLKKMIDELPVPLRTSDKRLRLDTALANARTKIKQTDPRRGHVARQNIVRRMAPAERIYLGKAALVLRLRDAGRLWVKIRPGLGMGRIILFLFARSQERCRVATVYHVFGGERAVRQSFF